MAFLLLLLWSAISWFIGRLALRILYRKQKETQLCPEDSFLTGGMIIIGVAEASHLSALFLARSFSDCIKLFWVLLTLCLFAAAAGELICRRNSARPKKKSQMPLSLRNLWTDKKAVSAYLVFGLLALVSLVQIVTSGEVYRQGDMTAETVNSFLESNAIYQINPLTGQAYESGIPLRLRILCLPTLYGIFSAAFGVPAVQLVWTLVPMLTMAGAYIVYFGIAKRLFADSAVKRGIFLAAAALILWTGNYMYGMDGFGLLYGGFRGVVIRSLVLVPYTFDLCIRRKWKLVALCIMAEACMVWTLYGMGVCLFVAAGMLVMQKLTDNRRERTGGRENSKCRSF